MYMKKELFFRVVLQRLHSRPQSRRGKTRGDYEEAVGGCQNKDERSRLDLLTAPYKGDPMLRELLMSTSG
jgi:hypothetical protein